MTDTPPAAPPDPAPTPPPAPQPEPQPAPATTPPSDTAAVKRAEKAAEKAAMQRAVEELGVKDLSEAKQIMDKVRAAGEAQKSEAQRLHDDATAAKAEADQIRAEAAAERLAMKIERKLLAAGVPEGSLTRVAKMIEVAYDASDEDIAAEVDTIKAEIPGLFSPAPTAGQSPAPGVAAPPRPPGTKPATTGIEAGAAKARAEREAKSNLDPFSRFKPTGL